MEVFLPGTRLGQFEVVSYPVISDVCVEYTCLDRERSHPALLKTLRAELQQSRKARDCFAESGAAWVSLGTHPHIVRCYNLFEPEKGGAVYLVLQLVVPEKKRDTPSLRAWLSPGQPLPVLQSLLFALQIARGMRHVSRELPGYVHGDLKPENILVGGGRLSLADVNRLRVSDFGMAGVLRANDINLTEPLKTDEPAVARTQLSNGAVGTPLYMSPEQWRGESAGTASDIYALGCILYRMLIGRHPVAGTTTQELRSAHCTGRVRPMPASLPEPVIDLVTRCLRLEAEERYQSWGEVELAIAVGYKSMVNYPVPAAEAADALTESERVLEGWFLNSMGDASSQSGKINTAIDCIQLALKVGTAEGDKALVGAANNNLGVAYSQLGDSQRAIEQHQQALTMAGECGDRSTEGSALNNLGMDYAQLGNPHQALEYINQALAIARQIGDRQGEMATLVNLGNVYHQLGDLQRAIQYHEQELEIARRLGDRRGESAALANLGAIYSDLGDDRRAIEYQEKSLALKSEIGDTHSQIAGLNNLANAYRNLGQAQRAFKYYNQALEIARGVGDRRGEAFALNNMGATYANTGDMERALRLNEQALEIFREIGDKRSQGDCLTNMGFIYMRRHEPARALEICEQALAIDREVGDMRGLALDSFNMANLLAGQDRFGEALRYAEDAARILEQAGISDKAHQARQMADMLRAEINSQTKRPAGPVDVIPADDRLQILQMRRDNPALTANMPDEEVLGLLKQADQAIANDRPTAFIVQAPKAAKSEQDPLENREFKNLSLEELRLAGQKLVNDGRWQEAELAFRSLQEKSRLANDNLYQALALLYLGWLSSDKGDKTHALDLFRQALSLATLANQHKILCRIYDGMGTAYERQGSYKEAIEHHTFAIKIAKTIGYEEGAVISRGNLGNVYLDQGNFEQAAKVFKELLEYAIRKGDAQISAQAYNALGRLYHRQGHLEQACDVLSKSLEIALRIGDQPTAARDYATLGDLYTDQGDYPIAVQMIRKELGIIEHLGIEPEIAQKYADLASLYTKMGDLMEAFLCYDRALFFYESTSDQDSLAKTHFNMGILYRKQGKFTQAREQYQQAQAIFESIDKLENAAQAERQWRDLKDRSTIRDGNNDLE